MAIIVWLVMARIIWVLVRYTRKVVQRITASLTST
jgi:hypothetical protein